VRRVALWDEGSGQGETVSVIVKSCEPLEVIAVSPEADLIMLAESLSMIIHSASDDASFVARSVQSNVFDVWDALIEYGEERMRQVAKGQSNKFWISFDALYEMLFDPELKGVELREQAMMIFKHKEMERVKP
jgi:hypothetical protein